MFSLLYEGLHIHCTILSLLYSVCTLCNVVNTVQMFVRCFNIVLLSILYHVHTICTKVSVRFRYTSRMSRYQLRTDWLVGNTVCESLYIHSIPIPDTVEPVHKDRPRDQELVVFIQRCCSRALIVGSPVVSS